MKLILSILFWMVGCAFVQATERQLDLVVGKAAQIQINSTILKQQRDVVVYLPDNYHSSQQSYPTLYLLDGERHLNHAVLATRLYQELNQVPQLIIVAIHNRPQEAARSHDLYHNRAKFAEFMGKELREYIDSRYRTTQDATLYGHSLAAFFTVDLLSTHPEYFDRYIAASPPLQNFAADVYQRLEGHKPMKPKSLYLTIASRTAEGDEVFDAYLKFTQLLEHKSPVNLQWEAEVFADQNHISNYYISFFKGISIVFDEN